jgi:hypothetical protein
VLKRGELKEGMKQKGSKGTYIGRRVNVKE